MHGRFFHKLCFAPEINSVDIAVSEEQGAVMRMVFALARDVLTMGYPRVTMMPSAERRG